MDFTCNLIGAKDLLQTGDSMARIQYGDAIRLPSFQRAYVWAPEQGLRFWESILKRVYLGTIILWSDDYQRPYLLDGQQRISTIRGQMFNGKPTPPIWWDTETEKLVTDAQRVEPSAGMARFYAAHPRYFPAQLLLTPQSYTLGDPGYHRPPNVPYAGDPYSGKTSRVSLVEIEGGTAAEVADYYVSLNSGSPHKAADIRRALLAAQAGED